MEAVGRVVDAGCGSCYVSPWCLAESSVQVEEGCLGSGEQMEGSGTGVISEWIWWLRRLQRRLFMSGLVLVWNGGFCRGEVQLGSGFFFSSSDIHCIACMMMYVMTSFTHVLLRRFQFDSFYMSF